MGDDIESVGLPERLSETHVLSKFANDPCARVLREKLQELFDGQTLSAYKKDGRLPALIEDCTKNRKAHPLVDKDSRIVFVLSLGNHQDIMGALYKFWAAKKAVKAGQDLASIDLIPDLGDADKYLEEGLGYFFSGADPRLILQGKHMVYGADYKQDRNDRSVFSIYADKGQMRGIPKEVRDALDTPEMRRAREEAERRAARLSENDEEKS